MAKEDTKVEDDIKIEVVDDPIETNTTTEVKVDGAKTEVKVDTNPAAGVADLQRQLDASNARVAAEQRARREADARAHAAGNQVNQTRAQAVEAYEVSAKQAKQSGEASLKAAKARFKSAMEAGNFDEAGDAQGDIATATNTISGANYQLTQLETVKKQMGEASKVAATSTAATAERRTESENVRDTSGGRTKSWIDAHPAFHADISFYNKAMSAHYAALRDGIEPESDAYFAALNKGVEGTAEVAAKAAPATTTATAAAPSRASATQARNERPELVRLTKAQMEAAEIAGMKPQEYARHLLALQAENKIGRTTH